MASSKKIIIVGGVAGGASCATRLRRLDEKASIVMIERGPYVSFANCGLPYHLSGIIPERESLLVTSATEFQDRFNIQVKTLTEAISIDRENKRLTLQNKQTQEIYFEDYDSLVLSPGAEPFRPPIPGLDLPGIFTLRNIPDLDRIINYIDKNDVKTASVLGAGFIGIEVAENLRERGISVKLIEKAPQLMPLFDKEMACYLEEEMRHHGVEVLTDCEIINIKNHSITDAKNQLLLTTNNLEDFATDLLIVAIGVRPETKLAQEAGIEIGSLGGIKVDSQFRTNDPNIFAIGDAIETIDSITNSITKTPLAGPANRQGRMVAEIISGRERRYQGTIGTSILKVFNLTAASVGVSEKIAQRLKIAYQVAWVHGKSHSSYYPNAKPIVMKILFTPKSGDLLGAQAVGESGVDKRMDVLATALAAQMTVYDLEDLDLSYAPPYSSAKDPVNTIAMVSAGMIRGDHPTYRWDEIEGLIDADAFLLDVRKTTDIQNGLIKGAHAIPLEDLRSQLSLLPKAKPIWVYCQEGYRGYVATRILRQYGFEAYNLLGGFKLWKTTQKNNLLIEKPVAQNFESQQFFNEPMIS